ncbi:hypothetical protein B0H65DRAFT_440995 [Neurospora tetraspora]|uniref:Uncharacterized protein n=1 Tax=Neurospora tetraspora TaxID=94610 RepID=A0AAE0MTP5_9PEZI|nr:hypothetical protein B0H65DRAFT_440995 [Neurospora tetraspora]
MSLPQASLPLHARCDPVNTDQPEMPQYVDFAAGVAKNFLREPELPALLEENGGQDANTGNGDNDHTSTNSDSSEPAASPVALGNVAIPHEPVPAPTHVSVTIIHSVAHTVASAFPSPGSIISESPAQIPALSPSPSVATSTPALGLVQDPTSVPSGQSLSMAPASASTSQCRPVSVSSPAPATTASPASVPTITPPPHATASTAGNRKRPNRKLSRELSSLAQLGGPGNVIGSVIVRKRRHGNEGDASDDTSHDVGKDRFKRVPTYVYTT